MIFGAAIIAVVQFFQLVLMLVDNYTKDAQKKNCMLMIAIKCARCCAWCLRKTVEFISFYGFVFVAVDGQSFCLACKETFRLVIAYPAQTAVNKICQKLLKLLIGYSTPVICAVCAFYWLDGDTTYSDKYNPFYAALVVGLVAFIIADGVCIVFDVAIDTIYICAFKDMEENKPPKFMSNNLRKAFGIDEAEDESSAGVTKRGGYEKAEVAPEP